MILSRREALYALVELLQKAGYDPLPWQHGHMLFIDVLHEGRRLGALDIGLLGELGTTHMNGADRKAVLQLVPDDWVIEPSGFEILEAKRVESESL